MSNESGRLLLTAKDFVPVVDGDGNEVGSVPRHWGEHLLPDGVSFKKGRAPKGTKSSEGEPKGESESE